MNLMESYASDGMHIDVSNLSFIVIDDDEIMRTTFEVILRHEGYRVISVPDAAQALHIVQSEAIDIALVDLVLQEDNGIMLIQRIREIAPQVVCVMVTGHGTIECAVKAMQAGAWDFISKPFSPNMLIEKLERIKEYCLLRRENNFRRKVLNREFDFSGVIGPSMMMHHVYEMVLRAAQSNLPVLIQGETGSGKEFIAEAIHLNSKRKNKPYVIMDCTSIPHTLMENTLFGSTKGAYTGAVSRKGLLEEAHQGTLFLDEVAEIEMDMQPKLLRCLETGRFRPVGSTKECSSDFRIICATNRDLQAEVDAGRFRSDLFYRISAMCVRLPALRERSSDIPILAKHFLQVVASEHDRPGMQLSPEALSLLSTFDWPGNIRQLRFMIESSFFHCPDELIRPEHLHRNGYNSTFVPEAAMSDQEISFDLDFKSYREEAIRCAERIYIEAQLKAVEGDVRQAAKKAGLTREAFYRVMARCDLTASDFRPAK